MKRALLPMLALLLSGGLALTACDEEEQQEEPCPAERLCPVGGANVCCSAGTQCKPVCVGAACTPQCVKP